MTPVSEVPPTQTTPTPPDWVAESKLLQDALLYVRSLRAALNHPWAFASSWALGTEKPMNPLSFFSISLGLVLAARGLERWAFDGTETLIEKTSIPSYLLPIMLGYYLHRTMLRKSGAKLSITVGAVLFALGSWGTVVSLFTLAARAGEGAFGKASVGWTIAVISARSASVGAFVAGAHQRSIAASVAWSMSFYLLPIALGWGLITLGNALLSAG